MTEVSGPGYTAKLYKLDTADLDKTIPCDECTAEIQERYGSSVIFVKHEKDYERCVKNAKG